MTPHNSGQCKFTHCENIAVIDGYCPFHFSLICKKESKESLKNIENLLGSITKTIHEAFHPKNLEYIIKPNIIPPNCYYFNSSACNDPNFLINHELPECQNSRYHGLEPYCTGPSCRYFVNNESNNV